MGSFNCTCTEGFEGDGLNCTGKLNIVNKHCVHVNKCKTLMQTFQSVKEGWMTVTKMQLAQTQLEVMTAVAGPGLLEMDLHVQVSNYQAVA